MGDDVRAGMKTLSTDELRNVVTVDAPDDSGPALEAAREELRARGEDDARRSHR